MNKIFTGVICLTLLLSLVSCGTEKKVAEAEVATTEAKDVERIGFATIEDLSKALVESLKKNDYSTYYAYVMSKDHEKALASQITGKKERIRFEHEFDFSLREEQDYFNNMVNFLKTDSINLDNANISESLVVDYEKNKYAPLNMKEVLIPVMKGENEIELMYVTVQIDGKWYLTSELGI